VVKRVVPDKGRIRWAFGLLGAECAGRMDLAERHGIHKSGVVLPRGFWPEIVQFNVLKDELLGIFAGVAVPITSRELSHTISSTTILICRGACPSACAPGFASGAAECLKSRALTFTAETCMGFRKSPITPEWK
jgi:hypothetical protein